MENEMVFTHKDMAQHRADAVADTMRKVRNNFELELLGLEDIAKRCKDETIKAMLERRIARMRRMLAKND